MRKPSIKRRRRIAFVILTVVLLLCMYNIYAFHPVKKTQNPDFVHAEGNVLHDQFDHELTLQGTNIGGWLVPEGWLSNLLIAGQDDDVEGEKLTYLKLMDALFSNPTVQSEEKAEELINAFIENWFTEDDVKIIKGMGLNCIRVPFGWFNLYSADGERKENAFEWLDKCVQWCEGNEIYLILDCHGAFGSQNKEHHSGDDTQMSLFTEKVYREYTTNMWVAIAERYRDYRYIAGYDLLNEPMGKSGITTVVQWNFYNELYSAIRAVDPYHLIIIESCWGFQNLPNPNLYGWENVAYEYHWYNPNTAKINAKTFITFENISERICSYHNVPILIGEFSLGDSYEDLELLLDFLEKRNWSWTSWTYKTNSSWNWGMYCLWRERINASVASYDSIYESWSDTKTDINAKSDACNHLLKYLESRKAK